MARVRRHRRIAGFGGFGLVTLAALATFLIASAAAAPPPCSDTITPTTAGTYDWGTASNWSTGKVPSGSDVACWGPNQTVQVNSGENDTADSVQGGGLSLEGGTLSLQSASNGS